MHIKLNDIDIDCETEGLTTLGQLFEEIKKKEFEGKEFIISIKINDDEVPTEGLEGAMEKPLEGIDSLLIRTTNPGEVSLSTLANLPEFLDTVIVALGQSADKFRTEDENEANKFFIKCVDGLQTFIGLLEKVKNLNDLDFETITYDSIPLVERERSLLKAFSSLYETQKQKDWITLADLLEYEMVPQISEWKNILPVLSETIKNQ